MNTTGIPHSKALPRLHIKVTNYTPKLLSYGCSYDRTKDSSKEGMALRPEELETIGIALRELGMSYDETVKLMSEVTIDSKSLKSLWGKPSTGGQKGSRLIKLGVSLIAFPIPTIGVKKSLGAVLIAAGLIHERIKHIHVADIYRTFQEVNIELQKLQQKSV